MKSRILLFTVFLIIAGISATRSISAQCQVTAYVYPDTVQPGDEITVNAYGTCGLIMTDGFEFHLSNSFSPTTLSPAFTNPCGSGPVGLYLWADSGSTKRVIETVDLDLSMPGTTIEWWMKYGSASVSGACHSLSTNNAGVHLQYSNDGGNTWTDFPAPNKEPVGNLSLNLPFVTDSAGSGGYWAPHSSQYQTNSELYYWNQYKNDIPPPAQTSSTRIRWFQTGSFTHNEETWGIDEVEITYPSNSLNVQWSTGDTMLSPPKITIPQNATNDTSFIVTVSDEYNNSASDTCFVTVLGGSSINHITNSQQVQVYPNPNNGCFTLELANPSKKEYSLQISNLEGKIIYRNNFQNRKKVDLNVSGQASGVYILKLSNREFSAHRKIIVR